MRKKVILVSGSPRRKELLKKHGYLKKQILPKYDDTGHPVNTMDDVEDIAIKKLASVEDDFRKGILLSCDTVVYFKDHFIGKPTDREDGFEMLRKLSGEKHTVVSCLVMKNMETGRMLTERVKTDVHFDELTDEEIHEYLDNAVYGDKAGGYAIQEEAALFITKINGDFYNVVGFPLNTFYRMIKEI